MVFFIRHRFFRLGFHLNDDGDKQFYAYTHTVYMHVYDMKNTV